MPQNVFPWSGGGASLKVPPYIDGDALKIDQYGTFYCDAANGSDKNDGLTPATAFQTFDYAYGFMSAIRWANKQGALTLQLQPGTYPVLNIMNASLGCSGLRVTGNSTDPNGADVKLDFGGGICQMTNNSATIFATVSLFNMAGFIVSGAATSVTLFNVTLDYSAAPYNAINVSGGAVTGSNINFVFPDNSAITAFISGDHATLNFAAANINVQNSAVISGAFLSAANFSTVNAPATFTVAAGKTVTGSRYALTAFTRCWTNNAGATHFPGSTAGTADASSTYA